LIRYVVTSACVGCGGCLRCCPERAIRPVGSRLVVLDSCSGCGACMEVCPVDACVEVAIREVSS
jgi:ferredoxin